MSEPSSRDVVIDVRDLRKRYAGTAAPALDGVSFQLHRGEVLGLLGPNGAGKTTAIEIITGFRRADSGHVAVLGLDPQRRSDLRELRRRVGYVPQEAGHYRFLTVRETIAMHRAWYDDPRDVDEVLDLVGLADAANQRVRRLSGGQQRRLDVGVALVGRPELVLLDEPTTGFDPAARRRAWDVIAELAELGTSVLLTTHYMEEATRLADRVVVVGSGRVLGEGTAEQLARELRLETVIRARVPEVLTHEQLPDDLRAGLVAPGRFELQVQSPTGVLAQLCQWSLDADVPLEDLDVRAPSLEESYLALTGNGAQG